MSKALRVLCVEDSEEDSLLLLRELRNGGYDPVWERVDTADALSVALEEGSWDLVLADFAMPGFGALAALKLVRQAGLDLPFIVVSGVIGEEQDVAMMKAGAHDYVFKDNLKRLLPAIERELNEAAVRRQRKRAEEEQQKLVALIENTSVFVGMASLHEKVLYVNPEGRNLVGLKSSAEMENTTIADYLPEAAYVEFRDAILPSVLKAGRWEGELQLRHFKTGDPIDVEARVFTVKSPGDGGVLCLGTVLRDITERKQAEERQRNFEAKLQQTQKLESLGVLAGGIAHDFNNLLMGVLGNADIALLELPPESPARGELMNITTAALRAAELTKQMLAYSGKGKFVVEALNLSKLVEEMAHLLEVSISKNVVLKYNFSADLPAIEADASQIRQVVMNLIINASEAIGEKSGVVAVSTSVIKADRSYLSETYLDENPPEGDYVSLEVADTGCGMDEQTRKKIFDPFFTTKFTGRGLGLAAVLGIVRGHGGALKIYSEPQRGTTFKVLFPASQKPAEESVATSATEQQWRGSGVILVVDDEEAVRIATKRMLEKLGFTVLTAEDGRAALEVFRGRADEIVAVLLDLTMPHLDGEETFRELRRIRPDVRVILSSGYNEQETTDRFAGKGLAGFLQKPYRVRQLGRKIRQVLETPPESDAAGASAE